MTISLKLHGEAQFASLEEARRVGQAIDLLLNMADTRLGSLALSVPPAEGVGHISLYAPRQDTSGYVRGFQAATELATRYIKEIELVATQRGVMLSTDDGASHWQPLLDGARRTGEVDLRLFAALTESRLGLTEPYGGLAEVVGKVATDQARRALNAR